MKGISVGLAGCHGLSRMQGTKVRLAWRKALLPNKAVISILPGQVCETSLQNFPNFFAEISGDCYSVVSQIHVYAIK